MACGGKLYQLVVEDEETGKQLLSHGQVPASLATPSSNTQQQQNE